MLYPIPAVMVSCGDMEQSNILTIAWTGILNSVPPMTYISVRKSRYSHDIIRDSGEFVINLVTEDLARACDYCGVRSGASEDKFREAGLTKAAGEQVSAPMIAESPVNLECRVFEVKELPSHDVFMAEIVAVHVREDLVDEKGAYHFERLDLVSYNHGHYYRVERKSLGRFGFSVMKPKTIRRKRKEAAEKRKAKR
ncbi:MAG: flavin reductase family protein [Mogibacterium sp.]|nr:flavin reductase family protein [Mogibacterium sp.]